MKDGLQSAEMRAVSMSGTNLYAGTSMSGTKVFTTAGITAVTGDVTATAGSLIAGCSFCTNHSGTTLKIAGSLFSAGGSVVGLLTAGSFTATD